MLENGAEQSADMRRLRFRLRRRGLLAKRSAERSSARLPRHSTLRSGLRVTTRQRRKHDRTENQQQFSCLIGRESGGLLHSLLHGFLMLAENLAENSAAVDWRASADEAAETSKNSSM